MSEFTPEFEAEMQNGINPAYAMCKGTESYERRILLAEINRLREIERLYNEALEQEPVGYIDTMLDNFYTPEEWPVYIPAEDNLQGVHAVFTRPVPQEPAVPDNNQSIINNYQIDNTPEGWQLVPKIPTNPMLRAAQDAWLNDPGRKSSTIYAAMLAAAPKGGA